MDDLFFHFKIRNESPAVSLRSPHEPHGSSDSLYGYCVFHQELDQLSKRKYEQKTLVLITNHSFPAFYIRLLRVLAPSFAIDAIPALEAACTQIANWYPPTPGDQQLPFLGSLINLNMFVLGFVSCSQANGSVSAAHAAFPLQGLATIDLSSSSTSQVIHAYAPETTWEKLIPFLPSAAELYVVYEKMLLCEPVIFLSSSPQICSEFVSAMVDLIRPVPYKGEIRPYLTMQSAFCSSSLDGGLPRHFLIGVTNPFLLSRILSLAASGHRTTPHVVQLRATDNDVPLKVHKSRLGKIRRDDTTPADLPGDLQAPTRAKTVLAKDYPFLSSLNSPTTATSIDSTIRRHFSELTASFLSPLSRYFTTLLPANASPLSPGGTRLQYAHFDLQDFLRSLNKHGAAGIVFKGRTAMARTKTRDSFYKAFCSGPGFFGWLEGKIGLERGAASAFAVSMAAAERRDKEVSA